MTNDEKKLAYSVAGFVGFKILLLVSINYASRVSRRAAAKYTRTSSPAV